MKSMLRATLFTVSLTLGVATFSAPAQAFTMKNFEVILDDGPLSGNTYSGSFEFDDSKIEFESAPLTDFDFTFEGADYDLIDAARFGEPRAYFNSFLPTSKIVGIDYLVSNFDVRREISFRPGFSSPEEGGFSYRLGDTQGGGSVNYSKGAATVPTPALLPGLVGMSVAALRKKRQAS